MLSLNTVTMMKTFQEKKEKRKVYPNKIASETWAMRCFQNSFKEA